MKPTVSPVAALLATETHSVSSAPQEGVSEGGLALVASPDAVVASGGVVPCQLVNLKVIHAADVPVEAVQVAVPPSSVPSAIL